MNNKIRITKEFSLETGHALYGYDGLCKNVHGHSYKLYVTIIGKPIDESENVKLGMVIDFSDLKKIVKEEIITPFDHATVLNCDSPHNVLANEMEEKGNKIVRVNYQPTCEMLVSDFASKIQVRLPGHLKLHSLKLRETATAYAEWYAEDNSYLESETI